MKGHCSINSPIGKHTKDLCGSRATGFCRLHLISIPGSGRKTKKTSWLGKIEAFTPVWEEGTIPFITATEMCHLGKGSKPEEQRKGPTYKHDQQKCGRKKGGEATATCHWKHHACGEAERRVATAAAIPGKQTKVIIPTAQDRVKPTWE